MAQPKRDAAPPPRRRGAPAKTPEERQNQLIGLAFDVAEEQLLSGNASSQIITHLMKLGTLREQAELEKIKLETELVRAKTEAIAAQGRIEELYKDAIVAMRRYQGHAEDTFDD